MGSAATPAAFPPSLDTTTPSGKAMFQMLGVFAEFERAMIRDRVQAILADLAVGALGIRKIAAKHGVGVSVVQRLKGAGSEGTQGNCP